MEMHIRGEYILQCSKTPRDKYRSHDNSTAKTATHIKKGVQMTNEISGHFRHTKVNMTVLLSVAMVLAV